MRNLITFAALVALAIALIGCGGEEAVDETLPEEVIPPETPGDLKDAETAYTYLMTNWADGNFENVYLACDAGTKETLNLAWDEYKSARDMIFENMEEETREGYLTDRDFGPLVLAGGVQEFFAVLCEESDYAVTVDDELKAAGFEITATEEVDENTTAFENNWIDVKITMAKDGEYWFTDYFRPLADDALSRAKLDWNVINEEMGLF
ncbi:MAG: hypothetical protein JSW52_05165 [Candidatus Coatesbacteria bacterium]|nr:MAG: hypothetical protein JSW52_05165 [Candidatus Coatesbacteria bacterium]